MIEEMVGDIAKGLSGVLLCEVINLANTLIAQGYRKIPEGSVFVSKERYSMFCELENKHIKDSEEFRQQARKETAKEIIEMFADKNYITEQDLITAIAKRYGVEE